MEIIALARAVTSESHKVIKHSDFVLRVFVAAVFLAFIASFATSCSSDPVEGPTDAGGGDDVDVDFDADVDAPPIGTNACGGDEELEFQGEPAAAGGSCGECDDGVLVCDGEDALECIGESQENACGGCGDLPAEPETSCGPCDDGVWSCDGEGSLVCEGATDRNICGGCEELDETPGEVCDAGEGTGVFRCTHVDSVQCILAGQNACGGISELERLPGTPCGECNLGVTVCDETEAVTCHDEEAGLNECGGCTPLRGEPDTSCGICGGEWYCADDDLSVCDDFDRNPCGGCADLSGELNGAMPGDECGEEGQVWVCQHPDKVVCPDEVTNACGGSDELDSLPGDICGECGDGLTICTAPDSVVCHGATETNECGGCGLLAAEEGEECGAGTTWQCTDDGSMRCKVDEEAGLNACGGTEPLDGHLGQTCGPCDLDVLACDGDNALVCSGETACPDLLGEAVEVSDVEEDSATFEAELVEVGPMPVTDHGFCWSEEESPLDELDNGDHCESLGEADEEGSFSLDVDELSSGTKYYVVAFATVADETSATEEASFWTKTEAPLVVATTDLQDRIALSWESVEGAEHYLVHRDGTEITEVDATSFDDTGADQAPAPDAPQITEASDDLTEGIEIAWSEAQIQPGTLHEYEVLGVNADELESESSEANGQRAAYEVEEYEICVGANCDDDDWATFESPDDATSGLIYLDTTAPVATIGGGSAEASEGEYEDFVRLQATGWQIEDASERAYQVRALSEAGAGEASEAESGQRATGELQYEWFGSALDASGNFTSLFGPDESADTHDDTEAPEDGSDRHYYVALSAAGAASVEYPGTDNPLVGFVMSQAEVVTLSAQNVGINSATMRGQINHIGTTSIAEVGLCRNRSQPAEEGLCTAADSTLEEGEIFEVTTQTLGSGRQYYVRAYFEDDEGNRTYADHRSFTTNDSGDDCDSDASPFGGGEGEEDDPHLLCTPKHLNSVGDDDSSDACQGNDCLDDHFRVVADIDMEDFLADNGVEFNIIGDGDNPFEGTFDGGGQAITGLTIGSEDDSAGNYAGLFGVVGDGAVIENVVLEDVKVFGGERVGGLVGHNEGGSIIESYATGSVDGSGWYVGGLVGRNNGEISKSHATVSVEGEDRVGGLAGRNNGQISESYATGSATVFVNSSGWYVGGLVGYNDDGEISKSHATGDVEGKDRVGGLVGRNRSGGQISESYATGSATVFVDSSGWYVGGLVGYNDDGEISKSHATGSVEGNDRVGGLAGRNSGEISESYATGSATVFVDSSGRYVGGLVGRNYSGGQIIESYATGDVQGTENVGGLVGRNRSGGQISESYATGDVKGDSRVGGLVGLNNGEISKSHAEGSATVFVDSSGRYVGGLVGRNYSEGQISESYATGDVQGTEHVGGLVGRIRSGGQISESYATGDVDGDSRVGGLVGRNNGEISKSHAEGSVEGDERVGGLVGRNYSEGQISESYATGDVDGSTYVGGLVGEARAGIRNSYALGDVEGDESVGGLVGLNADSGGFIENSYSAGAVNEVDKNDDAENVGGLVGRNESSIDNSVWDQLTTTQSDAVGLDDGGTVNNVEGLDTGAFAIENQFSDAPFEWDFHDDEIWTIGTTPAPDENERPIFQWQND